MNDPKEDTQRTAVDPLNRKTRAEWLRTSIEAAQEVDGARPPCEAVYVKAVV